jgi:hypothetical protein
LLSQTPKVAVVASGATAVSSPVARVRATSRLGRKLLARPLQRALRLVCAVAPRRVSFACIVLMHHVLGAGGRVLAIRALTPVAAKGIVRNPELKLSSWITTRFQEDAEIILFRLGLYRELADILRRRGAAVYSLDSARLLAQLMFELGEFEVAHKALSQWASDPYFRSAPDLLQLKASLDLVVGREEDAVPLLKLATTNSPRLAAPHQNIAARTPAEYLPTALDTKVGYLGYLYDTYNFIGQRVTHVGSGHLGTALYARALSAQKRLRAFIPEISFELRMLLLELGIDPRTGSPIGLF